MGLKEDLRAALTGAMKARDELTTSTMRLVGSSIKYKEIEKGGELTDEEILSVLITAAKQRREAADQYEKGGRQELAEKELAELKIIEGFMPARLSEDEIKEIIQKAVAETGASGPADMGRVMKAAMPHLKGRADGKQVNELVKAALGA